MVRIRCNSKKNEYQRKGYKVTHYYQRHNIGIEHYFILSDQGAKYLPKARHLIRALIPVTLQCGAKRKIDQILSGLNGVHEVWYKVLVSYKERNT